MQQVPEEWHLMETRKFMSRIFESTPDTPVAYVFPTYVRGNMPVFMSYIAQYALEKSHPIWLVTFYGEPKEKHVGGYLDEDQNPRQIYSIDPDYIEIGAVKLPAKAEEADAMVGRAARELRNGSYWRIQTDEANAFHISDNGDVTAQLLRNGHVVKGPVLLGNYKLGPKNILGRASDELFHVPICSKFDPKPDNRLRAISPITLAIE